MISKNNSGNDKYICYYLLKFNYYKCYNWNLNFDDFFDKIICFVSELKSKINELIIINC